MGDQGRPCGAAPFPARLRRRQAPGLAPTASRNARVKWLWSAKPQLSAITLMLSSVRSNMSAARRIRSRTTH